MKTTIYFRFLVLTSVALSLVGCGRDANTTLQKTSPPNLRLATTTSTKGSGLLEVLIPAFEKQHGCSVTVISKGTGIALQLAREGQADVVLVHARSAEDSFISNGFGINRKDVMYNDFVLLGPGNRKNPFENYTTIDRALSHIAEHKLPFISRGDDSGTHIREKSLWEKITIVPASPWYTKSKTGMLATLKIASQHQMYVLSDRSTYLHNKADLTLQIVLEGDSQLYNPYGVIAVNPAKVSGANLKSAMTFIDFITSVPGQTIIAEFGKKQFGQPLFTPMHITTQ